MTMALCGGSVADDVIDGLQATAPQAAIVSGENLAQCLCRRNLIARLQEMERLENMRQFAGSNKSYGIFNVGKILRIVTMNRLPVRVAPLYVRTSVPLYRRGSLP